MMKLSSGYLEYFKERFPFIPLYIYCTLTIVGVSTGFDRNADILTILILGLIYVSFLLHIRVLDEFKDFVYDSKHHPERPVQKGSVKLSGLKIIGFLNLAFMISAAFMLFGSAAVFLIAALAYTFLMFNEFFISDFYERYLVLYMIAHEMVFIPLFLFFFSTYNGKLWFFTNFSGAALFIYLIIPIIVIEIGRKIKHRKDESGKKTHDTYAFRWGQKRTVYVFSALIISAGILSFMITGFTPLLSWLLIISALSIAILNNIKTEIVVENSMLLTTTFALLIPVLPVF
jgi:hypothetical protein